MNCEQIRERSTEYGLGDLDAGTAAEVRAHLESCPTCRAAAEETKATLALLGDALAAPSSVPQTLSAATRRRVLHTRKPSRSGVIRWFTVQRMVIAEVAAVVLVGLILVSLFLPAVAPARKRTFAARSQTIAGAVSPSAEFDKVELLAAMDQRFDDGIAVDSEAPQAYYDAPARGTSSKEEGQAYFRGAQVASTTRASAAGPDTLKVHGLSKSRRRQAMPKSKAVEFEMLGEPAEALDAAASEPLPPPPSVSPRKPAPEAGFVAGTTISGEWAAGNMGVADETAPVLGGKSIMGRTVSREARVAKRGKKDRLSELDASDGMVAHGGRPASAAVALGAERPPADVKSRLESSSISVGDDTDGSAGYEINLDMVPVEEIAEIKEDFSSTPAKFDSVAIVKSPVVMRGIVGSRSAGTRGRALTNYGGSSATEGEDLTEVDFSEEDDIEVQIEEAPPPEPAPEPEDLSEPRFKAAGVNPFVSAAGQPFSTFSIDVDTASYTLSRNYMMRGILPPSEAVRTEEFVNFFDYDYDPPQSGTFAVHAECAPTPFGRGLHLLKIGIKGRRLGRDEARPAVLTFVIDTSGSMNTVDRLHLVRQSLRLLLDKLDPEDRVAIVQFGSSARLVLEHTPLSRKVEIVAAVERMQASGSTNLEEAMRLAYQVAARGFMARASNRVLVMSDGAANLGERAANEILQSVKTYRKQGITCSVFGFGIGTYNDEMLETLADKGDGSYAFIDSIDEARRVFVDQLSATLDNIARDVKIQVEFSPAVVKQYRQIGYENRQLTKEQFRDDSVDAGEVGSGQSVTALYELLLAPDRSGGWNQHVATIRVRYRRADTGAVEEIERTVSTPEILGRFEETPARFRLAAGVAEFAEILRGCPHAAGSEADDVARVLRPVTLELNLDGSVRELLRLVESAGSMSWK